MFDDDSAITANPSIRHLWPITAILQPPVDCTMAGRPFANLSLAINYAWGGTSVRGYHAVNLWLHFMAGFLLFAIVWRTLLLASRGVSFGSWLGRTRIDALPLAFSVALIWSLHPLLTGTVSYISQRTELLMALCYLLTLFGFIRGVETSRLRWWMLSVAACFAGTGSKEVMVTAPVVILLYDRAFVSGSFGEAWRRRRFYYMGLVSSWLLLAGLLMGVSSRSVGFDQGVTWWEYGFTECGVILSYLRLVVWPNPLIFDYGPLFASVDGSSIVALLALGGIIAMAVFAASRWPRGGFLPMVFFLLLAPTSSVVPVSGQPMAENRMYLPTAAVVTLALVGAYRFAGRRIWLRIAVVAGAAGCLGAHRNADYQSKVALWRDTVVKRPLNPRAHEYFARALYEAGDFAAARGEYEHALRLKPDYILAHLNLAVVLRHMGETSGSRRELEEAVRLAPDYAEAHDKLGIVLLEAGDIDGAQVQFESALRLKPRLATAHLNLGNTLLRRNDFSAAAEQYRMATRLEPEGAEAEMNLGVALRQIGQGQEAKGHFERALLLRPPYPEAEFNLGVLLLDGGQLVEAREHLEKALRLNPKFPEAYNSLGNIFRLQGDFAGAERAYQEAIRLRPTYPKAKSNLDRILQEQQSRTRPASQK